MKNNKKIIVDGKEINIFSKKDQDYISLTDIIKSKDGEFFISDWLRNRNTIEFLGAWEQLNNKNFNYGEFAIIKNSAGLNNYKISVKKWIEKTKSIGIKAFAGRYGGTYAHKDIAFEFSMWISPIFKLYLIKEFQRLKNEENERLKLGWDFKRILTKINYKIHTDAIKEHIIPKIKEKEIKLTYASEADILNKALFGMTANEWKEKSLNKKGNIRDYADVYELVCLANLETHNSEFIKQGVLQKDRLIKLNIIAISQMKLLTNNKKIEGASKNI